MALATLSIDIEAKLANLEAGMDKAARIAAKNAQATEAAWQRAGATLAGLGATLAGAFAGVRLVDFVQANIDALDKLNDVADATGASVENISALEDVARRTGTTMDTVTTALVKFNGQLADAAPGSGVERALAAIGLQADELRQQDPAEALRRVAVALGGYADDGNKARLVQELFGKSVRDVAPLLKDLATQQALVATTTTEQAQQAEAFNKQLYALQANVADVSRMMVSELVPAFNQLFDALRGQQSGGDSAITELIAVPLQAVSVLGANVAFVLRGVGTEIGGMAAQAAALLRLDFKGFATIGRQMTDDARQAREEFDKLEQRLLAIGTVRPPASQSEREAAARRADKASYGVPSVGPVLPPPPAAPAAGRQGAQITEAQRALAAYVAELERELGKTSELTEQQKALNLLRSLGTAGEVPQVRELVLGLERQVTLGRQDAAIREDKLRLLREEEAAQRALNDEIYKLSGRADDARKQALTAALEAQLNAGVQYSPEELERVVKGIGGVTDDAKAQLTELDELTKQFGRNIQNALGDTLLRTLKGDFDSLGRLWGDLLLKMAAEAAAAQLGKSLFGDLFSGGDLGGLAKIGLSFFAPGFAAGGDFGGGLRLVGENGPELEATGPARIYNAQQTQQILRGAGPQPAAQIIYAPTLQIEGSTDRVRALRDAQQLMRQGQREMLDLLKAKGVL